MKIGILTFHRAHNYGAMLQAFALRHILKNMGNNVEFISYRQPKIEEAYTIWSWHYDFNNKLISNAKALLANILTLYRRYKRRKTFMSFAKLYLPETKKYTYKELQQKYLDYDAVIFGSDQIWTTRFLEKFDDIYWGDIKLTNGRRISYAPSMELKVIDESQKLYIRQHLKEFDNISVRESSMCDLLSTLSDKPITNVLDPTLLCTVEDYAPIIRTSKVVPNYKYILLYQVGDYPLVHKIANEVSRLLGYPIIEIGSQVNLHRKPGYKEDYGPNDFVALISQATFVVSCSFHGTALSVIFNKNFYSVLIPGIDARVTSFLSKLDLMHRGVWKLSDINKESLFYNIDYAKANQALEELRIESTKFIENALK